jgi:hypothetical protein
LLLIKYYFTRDLVKTLVKRFKENLNPLSFPPNHPPRGDGKGIYTPYFCLFTI